MGREGWQRLTWILDLRLRTLEVLFGVSNLIVQVGDILRNHRQGLHLGFGQH